MEDGYLFLSCAISPGYKDIRLILKHKDQKILELSYMNIQDIRYLEENGKECLDLLSPIKKK